MPRRKTNNPLRRLLNRLHDRLMRSRRGSVLVLVVVLLVLLALIGTAFISTARIDRASAQQNAYNTQVDLLLEGAKAMVLAAVSSDSLQIDCNSFNPFDPTSLPNGNKFQGTFFLANRLPVPLYPPQPGMFVPKYPDASLSQAQPGWWFMSGPIAGPYFESPYVDPTVDLKKNPIYPRYSSRGASPLATLLPNGQPSPTPMQLVPTSVLIKNGTGTTNYPAFYDPATKSIFLAASASGDGIADSGLVRLPIGEINGVTWYVATRVIDNGSANNASIAFKMNDEPRFTTILPGNFFPTNIDLLDWLPTIDPSAPELYNRVNGGLVSYRYNGYPLDFNNASTYSIPFDDNANQRRDFLFLSPYDQMWSQLGRRLNNPGLINAQGGRFQSLPITESMSMAYRFDLINPNASKSILEQFLPSATYSASVPYRPYDPGDVGNWYLNSFSFENENVGTSPPYLPRRTLLVAENPVNTAIVNNKFNAMSQWDNLRTFNVGDCVQSWVGVPGGPPPVLRSFVCIQPNFQSPPPNIPGDKFNYTFLSNPYWALMPWTNVPVKTNINTATFEQLYTAFWSVMFDRTTPTGVPMETLPAPIGTVPSQIFRNPIRSANASTNGNANANPQMAPSQVLQLRAALAAINAIQLRGPGKTYTNNSLTPSTQNISRDVISQQITIGRFGKSPARNVMLYGGEAQPYMTEVYADNHASPSGYVAIELHNPYMDRTFSLGNWQLATINRSGFSLVLTPLFTSTSWKLGGATVPKIPPGGYIVLASSPTSPSGTVPPTAKVGAVAPVPAMYVVPELNTVFTKELVLLRPRRADGMLSLKLTDPANPLNVYNETKNIQDLVPVDSYDFTGLADAITGGGTPMIWRYIRPSDIKSGKNWHFVYPGMIVTPPSPPGGGGGNLSFLGTLPPITDMNDKSGKDLSSLGVADAMATNPGLPPRYTDFPIQIANTDFGGPLKLNQGLNAFPFGGFARDGDILQVPFIGAYRIVDTSGRMIELNSVSVDSAFADDLDPSDDAAENIGRFCPINNLDIRDGSGGKAVSQVNDYALAPAGAASPQWRYHWAMGLFDYLTVQSPPDDYFPNVDPSMTGQYNGGPPTGPVPSYSYWNGTQYTPIVSKDYFGGVYGIANADKKVINAQTMYNANGVTEEMAPINGLIDINTAPWPVLATLPFIDDVGFQPKKPATVPGYNAAIAQAIVQYRDVDDGTSPGNPHGHGPFRSLFELNNVPGFRTGGFQAPDPRSTTYPPLFGPLISYQPGNFQGDLSPRTVPGSQPQADGVFANFEQQFLMLNRISNLVSLRTDSFTAYILVQGWRGAGTATPELVAQRRAALIIDRSAYNTVSKKLNVTNVPVE